MIASARRGQTTIIGVRTTAYGILYSNLDPVRHPS